MGSSHKRHSAEVAEERSLLPAVQSLLHGIGVHSPRGEPEQDRQFRTRLHRITEETAGQPSRQQVMQVVESAVSALKDHAERTNRYHRTHFTEMRGVIQLLVGTMRDLTIAGPQQMRRLEEIESQIMAATAPDQMREGKGSLAECLTAIRREAERNHREEGAGGAVDPVTGLPSRHPAEAALGDACTSTTPFCAVVLLVDRLALYNRRYGRDVGDKVLSYFVKFVKKSFEPEPPLFRWTGPALLLLRQGSHDSVHAEMRRVFDPRLDFEVDSGSRSILLPIGAAFTVVPMMVDPRLVINKIDAFVGG